MKKTFKLAEIIIFMLIICFTMAACNNGVGGRRSSGSSGGGGYYNSNTGSGGDNNNTGGVITGNKVDPVSKYMMNKYYAGRSITPTVNLRDMIKYSYSCEGYDFYYIYLGELKNIPLFSYPAQYHNGMDSTYTVQVTDQVRDSVSSVISTSSETAVSITEENVIETTTGGKASVEASAGYKGWGFSASVKTSAEAYWNTFTSDKFTNDFKKTTSLSDTRSTGTEITTGSMVSRSWELSDSVKKGYYRYTMFTDSDVYLYIIKDSTGIVYYEYKEHIKPEINYWSLDYSETSSFGKNDKSSFSFDSSLLLNLPPVMYKNITPQIPLPPPVSLEAGYIQRSRLGIDMAWIPAGTFWMGSPPSEAGRQTDEVRHEVTLTKGFWMGQYPVTQGEYMAVMGKNTSGGYGVGTDYPVYFIRWYDALVFCNNLSLIEGLTPAYQINGSTNPGDWGQVPTSNNAAWNAVQIVAGSTGYRLPTEAQWEYACRAGTETAYNTGNTPNTDMGWYGGNSGNSGSKAHPVGEKLKNDWNLYDMHGNVREWCWDWYGAYPSAKLIDPTGAVTGTYHVHRSGSWFCPTAELRSAHRNNGNPYDRTEDLSFRLVRPAE